MAVFYLLLSFLTQKLSIDRNHADAKDIYRVLRWNKMIHDFDLNSSAKTADYIVNNYGEVDELTRVVYPGYLYFRFNEIANQEKSALIVDSSFFRVFSFRMLAGSYTESLRKPYSVVIGDSEERDQLFPHEGDHS